VSVVNERIAGGLFLLALHSFSTDDYFWESKITQRQYFLKKSNLQIGSMIAGFFFLLYGCGCATFCNHMPGDACIILVTPSVTE